MESTALTLVERPVDVPTDLSPFAQMILRLESRHPSESATTHFGAVRWGGLLVRRLLADAAALVIDAVAKKRDLRMETLGDAKQIANITEARLNVGILLAHGTPENAAKAFEREVVQAVVDAARALSPPSTLSSLWTRPAYLFLAACVKRGREKAERLRPLANRLERRNRDVDPRHEHCVLMGIGMNDHALSLLENEGTVPSARECQLLVELPDDLDKFEAVLECAIRVLKADGPMRGHELLGAGTGLFEGWINTAILKIAAGDASVAAGPMSPEAATEAHARLKKLERSTAIVDRVVEIVGERTSDVSKQWRTLAEAYARSHAIRHVRFLQRLPAGPSLDDHFIDPYLSSGALMKLTHDQAIGYLNARSDEESMDAEELPEALRVSVENALDWGAFEAQDVWGILHQGKIPLSSVIACLGAMRDDVRPKIVEQILEEQPELVSAFLADGNLPWDSPLREKYAAHLAPADLVRDLRERLKVDPRTGDWYRACLAILTGLPDDDLRAAWDDPGLHDRVVDFADFILFEPDKSKVERSAEDRLVARLGERFGTTALESLVATRANRYSATAEIEYDEPLTPWVDLATADVPDWEFVNEVRRALGPRLAPLLATLSEDACYARYVANRPDKEALLAKFRADRKKFYGPR
jgi:hypothetical protein